MFDRVSVMPLAEIFKSASALKGITTVAISKKDLDRIEALAALSDDDALADLLDDMTESYEARSAAKAARRKLRNAKLTKQERTDKANDRKIRKDARRAKESVEDKRIRLDKRTDRRNLRKERDAELIELGKKALAASKVVE